MTTTKPPYYPTPCMSVSTSSGTCTLKEESPVMLFVLDIESRIKALNDEINLLESRLSSVIGKTNEVNPDPCPSRDRGSELEERLFGLYCQIDGITAWIASLRSRLRV